MATYLDAILDAHRRRASVAGASVDHAIERARSAPAPRDFIEALGRPGLSVIAEVKRCSPSKGAIAPDLVPGRLAAQYAAGGAAALSVLTDDEFFGGSAADLIEARSATALPVLRKDFTVSLGDVAEARFMGADAVLLIVAALDDAELRDFHALALELGMSALVETHDEPEVERALRAGARIVGVNQRDLATFQVDTERAVRVAASIPDGVHKVAESGIASAGDAVRLATAGYDAILVGEHLVTSGDPARALRELVAGCS